MGSKYGSFKFSMGEKILSYGRNLEIIDREYREKDKMKKGKKYKANEKFYKYKCLNCGNEDWIIEFSLEQKSHCGCNACCIPPKKLVPGINDISTVAPWMVKYFKNGITDATKYFKYSNELIEFICPDCGRKHVKTPQQVYANHGLTCPCSDNWSYPNKFLYSLFEQFKLKFQPEKKFKWSEGKIYDSYIEFKHAKIIVEMHGQQHYSRPIKKTCHFRNLEQEKLNDNLKQNIALQNGITNYFQINASTSSLEYLKNSIINSGLLKVLELNDVPDSVWKKCDKFATSNLTKEICLFKEENPDIKLREIAKIYKLAYATILRHIKKGAKLGWCTYEAGDDLKRLLSSGNIERGQKAVYCKTIDMQFRCATEAAKYLNLPDEKNNGRSIRNAIKLNRSYHGYEFEFVT